MLFIPILRKNILSSAFVTGLEKISSFILVILMARFLGVESYGHYAFAIAFTSLFAIIAELGLTNLLVREFSQRPKDSYLYFKHSLILKIFTSFFVLILLVIIGRLSNFSEIRIIEITLVGSIILLRNLTEVCFAVFRSNLAIQFEVLSTSFERTVAIIGCVVLLMLGYGLMPLLLLFLIARIFQFIFTYRITITNYKFETCDFNWSFSKRILSQVWPFLAFNFLMAINYRIDSIFLTAWHGDVATGYYNAAYNVIFSLTFIQVILGKVTSPIFSKLQVTDKGKFIDSYQHTIKFVFLVVIPLVLIVFFYSDTIIGFIYSSSYAESANILSVLIWALIFMYYSANLGVVITAIRKEKYALVSWLCCALFNVVLNLYAVPRFGYIGASVTTVLSEFFLAVSFMYLVSVRFRFPVLKSIDFVRLTALGMFFSLLLYMFRSLEMSLVIFTVLIVYFVAAILAKAISAHDLLLFRKMVSKS